MSDLSFHVRHYVPTAAGSELEHRTVLLQARDWAAALRGRTVSPLALNLAIDAHEVAGSFVFTTGETEQRLAWAAKLARHLVAAAMLAENLDAEEGGDMNAFDPAIEAQMEQLAVDYFVQPLPAWKRGISASALMIKVFEPLRYVVDGYIAEGLTVLAGAPKARKSWMMLDASHAVASEGRAFGSVKCEHGDVLFLALEDNQRRLQDRLRKMGVSAPPERLTLCFEWPTGDHAVAEIEAWAHHAENPVLVVVDVLARVREFTGREASYEADYRALVALQDLATKLSIAIVVVHHTRKSGADDPFDEVSGTRGLTGAADTVLVIRRDSSGGPSTRATLYGRGRDIPEIETSIEFSEETFRWKVLGDSWLVADTVERQQILDLLHDVGEPMKLADIAEALGKGKPNVSNMLRKMVADMLVLKPATGVYAPVKAMNPVNQGWAHSPHSSDSSLCLRCDGEGCGWCE